MASSVTIVLDGVTNYVEYGIDWFQPQMIIRSGDPNVHLNLELTGTWYLQSLTLEETVQSVSDLATAGGNGGGKLDHGSGGIGSLRAE